MWALALEIDALFIAFPCAQVLRPEDGDCPISHKLNRESNWVVVFEAVKLLWNFNILHQFLHISPNLFTLEWLFVAVSGSTIFLEKYL